ncbi:hypothetical protein QUC31_002651, partial [Theobroma cacao]
FRFQTLLDGWESFLCPAFHGEPYASILTFTILVIMFSRFTADSEDSILQEFYQMQTLIKLS